MAGLGVYGVSGVHHQPMINISKSDRQTQDMVWGDLTDRTDRNLDFIYGHFATRNISSNFFAEDIS